MANVAVWSVGGNSNNTGPPEFEQVVMSCNSCSSGSIMSGRGARAADQQGGSPVSRVRGGVPRGGRVRSSIYTVSTQYILSIDPGMTTCTARAPTVPGTTPTATTARQSITTGRSGTQRAASPSPGHVTHVTTTCHELCNVSRTLYCTGRTSLCSRCAGRWCL